MGYSEDIIVGKYRPSLFFVFFGFLLLILDAFRLSLALVQASYKASSKVTLDKTVFFLGDSGWRAPVIICGITFFIGHFLALMGAASIRSSLLVRDRGRSRWTCVFQKLL